MMALSGHPIIFPYKNLTRKTIVTKWHEWNDWRYIGCLIRNYSYSIQFRSFYVILCTPCGDFICVVTRDTASIFENVACIWNLGASFNCPLIILSKLQATVCTLRERPRIYHCVCFVYQILQTKPQNTFNIIKHVAILYLTSIQVMTKTCTWLMYCVVSNRVAPYILLVSLGIIVLSALPLTITDFGIIFFLSENVIGVLISVYQAVVVDTWHSTILDSRVITYDLIHLSQPKPYRSVTLTDWERGHYHIL